MTSNGLLANTQQWGLPSNCMAFPYEGHDVRLTVINGIPWFFNVDTCKVLDIQNPTDALSRLDDDEKSTLASTEGGPSRNIISESGLYTLIMTSRKPEAKKFRRWVTGEVIPAIRKAGSYSIQTKPMTAGELITAQAQLAIEHENRIETLIKNQAAMAVQLNEISQQIRPTAYSQRDLELGQDGLPLWWASWVLGTGSTRLTTFLRHHGIIIAGERSTYTVSQNYEDLGYVKVLKDWKGENRWSGIEITLKGRQWLHGLACRGALDSILDRDALIERLTPAGCLPLTLDSFDLKRH